MLSCWYEIPKLNPKPRMEKARLSKRMGFRIGSGVVTISFLETNKMYIISRFVKYFTEFSGVSSVKTSKNQLKKFRDAIDHIDAKLVLLLNERAKNVLK